MWLVGVCFRTAPDFPDVWLQIQTCGNETDNSISCQPRLFNPNDNIPNTSLSSHCICYRKIATNHRNKLILLFLRALLENKLLIYTCITRKFWLFSPHIHQNFHHISNHETPLNKQMFCSVLTWCLCVGDIYWTVWQNTLFAQKPGHYFLIWEE